MSILRFETAESILEYAIREERAAARFYEQMAERMTDARMRDLFLSFAEEERSHERKLATVELDETGALPADKIATLKLSDLPDEGEPSIEMSYAQALKLVISKEVAAFRMYTRLAEITEEPDLRQILEALALQEANHKMHFELELDELLARQG